MIRWPADKAMVTAQVSQVQEEPDSAANPPGPHAPSAWRPFPLPRHEHSEPAPNR